MRTVCRLRLLSLLD